VANAIGLPPPAETADASERQTRLLLLIAALVAAFNLRLGIAAPGPIIDTIRADTGMSSSVAGVLIMIPFACMGLFAFAGPPLIRRSSTYRIILLSLVLILVGTLARAVAPSPLTLIAATIPIGTGIALAAVTLPVFVKQHFVRHSGAVTGAYVSSLSLGVLVIAIAIDPLAEALGGWREAFAISAVPALIAIVVWIAVDRVTRIGRAPRAASEQDLTPLPRTLRPGRAELLSATVFGLQSMCYAAMVGWVAVIYLEVGWSPAAAGLTTASLGLFVIPGSLIFPSLSQGRDRRPWLAASVAVMALGLLGVAVAPEAAPLLWLAAFGIGGGASFALQLAYPIDLRETREGVARLTAWMLGVGYLVSALGPILTGLLRDLTGGFVVPMCILSGLGMIGVLAALKFPPPLPHRLKRPLPVQVAGP
jgi:CP family cyanate transporter-like MFS transporter